MSLEDLVSIEKLLIAYRKAKVDLYYSPIVRVEKLQEYETNLSSNLEKLKTKITEGSSFEFAPRPWTLIPKAIDIELDVQNVIQSDPQKHWRNLCDLHELKTERKRPIAEFRVMEDLPIEFHVFSTFWVHEVAHLFEGKLSNCAVGNRLRREKQDKATINKKAPSLDYLKMGSVEPYLYPYCKWRNEGLNAIERGLGNNKKIATITADVSSFFHKLNPSFLLDERFHSKIGVKLNPTQKKLNRIFVESLNNWAHSTPIKNGIPVGLTASAVIANIALFELDKLIEEEIVPLYYGRYVDDIILVLENKSELDTPRGVWKWIIDRSCGLLSFKSNTGSDLNYTTEYLEGSHLEFSNDKNRLFFIEGAHGKAMQASIKKHLSNRNSEWKALPDLPLNNENIEVKLLSAIQADGDTTDSLRKTNKFSVRRAEFAIQLRDIEAYARALPVNDWREKRHQFLDAFIRHILVLPTFFEFFNYLSRVISLATSCADFDHLKRIIKQLDTILNDLWEDCSLEIKEAKPEEVSRIVWGIKDLDPVLSIFSNELRSRVSQSIISAFPVTLTDSEKSDWKKKFNGYLKLFPISELVKIKEKNKKLFERDLGYIPFRYLSFHRETLAISKFPVAKKSVACINLPSERDDILKWLVSSLSGYDTEGIEDSVRILCKKSFCDFAPTGKKPAGFVFPTRPFDLSELYLIHSSPFSEEGSHDIKKAMRGLRGIKSLPLMPRKQKDGTINVEYRLDKPTRRIAISSLLTKDESWCASVCKESDPDKTRLNRIYNLLNALLSSNAKPDYIIFPELSLPPKWFLSIADNLRKKRISFICGVEYLHGPKKTVRNQTWFSLLHDACGFSQIMIYKQDKQRPAKCEEKILYGLRDLELCPETKNKWRNSQPPTIAHGDFYFSVLVCSELTNIEYRSTLRGKIDALFVPEWNKDIETFNTLVESAALDIHSYIIQCNNRQYGDSRIRAPYKDNWARDLMRIKGGIEDYFVVGEIDIQSLREFQSSYRSPDKPFKPLPDGFVISPQRKTLPK